MKITALTLMITAAMQNYYAMDWLDEGRMVKLPRGNVVYLCSTVGCQTRTRYKFTESQAQIMRAMVSSSPATAAGERATLRRQISRIERWTCSTHGVCNDSPDISWWSRNGQMDCVDEATNTTTYMLWLASIGALRQHRVVPPRSRGSHWQPVLCQRGGQCFTIDSDFNKDRKSVV